MRQRSIVEFFVFKYCFFNKIDFKFFISNYCRHFELQLNYLSVSLDTSSFVDYYIIWNFVFSFVIHESRCGSSMQMGHNRYRKNKIEYSGGKRNQIALLNYIQLQHFRVGYRATSNIRKTKKFCKHIRKTALVGQTSDIFQKVGQRSNFYGSLRICFCLGPRQSLH